MALSTELLKKFSHEDVPLSQKLIAAKILFVRSEFCYVSRKEQAVLEWLLELFNQDVGSDMLSEVWDVLQNCLESETINHLKVDINYRTKESLVKFLIQSLDTEVHGRTSMKSHKSRLRKESLPRECSVLILENPVFLYYFQKDIDSYLSLSRLILKSAVENGDIQIYSRYMKSVICFCDQSISSNNIFIRKILLPIVETFYSFKKLLNSASACDHKLEEDNTRIDNTAKYLNTLNEDALISEILNLIQRAVFPSFERKYVKLGLEHLFQNKNQGSTVLDVLIQFLVKNALYSEELLPDLYAFVFEAFVVVFKNDFNVVFRFLVTLCALLGLEISVVKDEKNHEICLLTRENFSAALCEKMSEPRAPVLFLVLQKIVAVLKKADLLLDETISEISFKTWMQALVIHLSASFGTYSEMYSVMTIIIELNPLIIAPVINKVLANVFVKPKTTIKEKEQYKLFFLAMFNSLLKIHPLQSFIRSNLFPTLEQVVEESRLQNSDEIDIKITDIIPDGFVTAFSQRVETILGNAWCIPLLGTFSSMLNQFVVVPMEEDKFDGGHQLFLEVLENLLVPFLEGIRVAEQTLLKGTYTKFSTNFLKLRTCLGRFCTALLQREHCSKSLVSFLHLCFAVGELHLLLLLYSPWSDQDEHLQIVSSANGGSAIERMHLLSFLSLQQWNDVRERALDLGDESCQKALNSLLTQQLRTLVIFEKSIDGSLELSRILGEYLIDSLEVIQLLKNSSDIAILVPLISHEKLVSFGNILTVHLVKEENREMLNLINDPVLGENKLLLISLVWNIMQKIGEVLSKRKRTHDSESLKSSYKCFVRDMCVYIRFSDLVQPKKNSVIQEYFLEARRKLNEVFDDLLRNDKLEMEKISFNLRKLLRYLVLLRCLPLPFLPQETLTFVALGILGVYVVLCVFSNESSIVLQNVTKEENNVHRSHIISVKNLCREILLGLLDGPCPISFLELVDVGLLVELLHRDGQCPKLLLKLLFKDCIKNPEHLQKVVDAVCLVDEHVKHHISIDSIPVSALLLQLLRERKGSHDSEEVRKLYQENTHHLLEVLSVSVDSRMKGENVSKESILALMSSYWCVMSSGSHTQFKMIIPYVDTFVSCAFSVLEDSNTNQETVLMSERLLEVVASSHMKLKIIKPGVCANVVWKTYKTLNRPRLVSKILKNAEFKAFKRVLKDLRATFTPSQKKDNKSKEFPDLSLPTCLVTTPMGSVKAPFLEQMVVCISAVAFNKIMQGECNGKVTDLLAFLLAVAERTQVPLPCQLADIILRTCMCALNAPLMSRELALSTSTTVAQLLLMMSMHHFALLNNRIPSFMQVYHMVVHTVVINSAVELQLTDEEAEGFCKCALEIEQLAKSLSKHSLDFKAVSQHIVAGMLQELEETTIHHKVKFHIMNSLYALMDLCDVFAFAHLKHALSPTSLELFKTVRSNYKKFYRYTGKV